MENYNKKRILMTTRKIIVEGGIYHVTQRAPGKEIIFVEDNDYVYFLHLLKKTVREFKLEIFCFALLPNHLHILLKIKEKNLSLAMKYLFQKYALWFNKKYERKGHVFCGAYRAAFCQDTNYLLAISLYIHLNPLKARLTEDIEGYRWTSLNCYLKSINNSFVRTIQILDVLGGQENGRTVYKGLIEDMKYLKCKDIMNERGAIKDFTQKMGKWLMKNWRTLSCKNNENLKILWEEDMLVRSFENIKRRVAFDDKKAAIYCIQQLRARGYTDCDIADRLGVNRTTVYRLMQQKC